jgi:hypothetical protein
MPSAEPTWRDVLCVPDPWPLWLTGTSTRTTPVSCAVASPTPNP